MTTVAVAISGMPRRFDVCAESLKKFVINPLEADVFVSTWDCKVPEDNYYGNINKAEGMIKTFDPKLYEIDVFDEKTKDILNNKKLKEKFPHMDNYRTFAQYFKLFKVMNLVTCSTVVTGKKYDLVVRTRSDLLFKSFTLPEDMNDRTVYMPTNHSNFGINDQCWVTLQDTAQIIAEMFFYLNNVITATNMTVPEVFLGYYLGLQNIKVEYFDCKYDIIRA